MNQHDLNWVKVHMDNWDPPDAPPPLPEPQTYDACSPTPSRLADGAATRETVTCQHWLAEKQKRKATTPHTLVWGEFLRATPPPPTAEADIPAVDVQEPEAPDEIEDIVIDGPIIEELFLDAEAEDAIEDVAAAVLLPEQGTSRYPSPEKLEQFPHARTAMSDDAAWGSNDSTAMSDTDVPSAADEL